LIKIGLTNSQAKVYTLMSQCGTSDAKTIWKNSKVGRQDLYRILLELQKIGLVERVIASPSQYRAIPMAEAISMLFQLKKNEVTLLQTQAVKLIETQCGSSPDISFDKYKYVMIPKEILNLRLSQAFERTQKSIQISSIPKVLSVALSTDRYRQAVKRGVQIRIIVNSKDKNCLQKLNPPFQNKPNFKIRWSRGLSAPQTFAIFDKREICLSTDSAANYLGASCLWSNSPSMINLLLSYFKIQWKTAPFQILDV
jgi:sugar-specific transcriptional regulator TrmB